MFQTKFEFEFNMGIEFDHTEGGVKKMKVRRYLTKKSDGKWVKFPIISFVKKEKCSACADFDKSNKTDKTMTKHKPT